jgi:hypothetical protein
MIIRDRKYMQMHPKHWKQQPIHKVMDAVDTEDPDICGAYAISKRAPEITHYVMNCRPL